MLRHQSKAILQNARDKNSVDDESKIISWTYIFFKFLRKDEFVSPAGGLRLARPRWQGCSDDNSDLSQSLASQLPRGNCTFPDSQSSQSENCTFNLYLAEEILHFSKEFFCTLAAFQSLTSTYLGRYLFWLKESFPFTLQWEWPNWKKHSKLLPPKYIIVTGDQFAVFPLVVYVNFVAANGLRTKT